MPSFPSPLLFTLPAPVLTSVFVLGWREACLFFWLQKEQTFKRRVYHSQDLSHSLQASLGLPQSADQQEGVAAEGTCG